MSDENKLKEKYMEFQMLEQSLAQLNQRKATIENQMNEFLALQESLDGLKKSENNSPMYSPLGSGVFIKSEVKDTKNVLVNIGSNIAIERSIEDSKKLIDKQMSELKDIISKLEKEISDGLQKGNELSAELASLSQKDHVHGPNCKH
ncbi:prefoldin subunit alpha [Candidatus Woesearchaeota archaeon]|jgi:prefoldin alpha subunit|nr:prefoldin subunit alpha [Candidatus Woesearchaeota archaeon]MBT6044930.1 prefoldin subunit alpha [Candidatus Woesearchaeota archaeon]